MSYAYGKQYYVCVTCMRWCSNTESVPLLVSNIHDIILVRTKYVLVCTGLYSYSFPVPVCTRYVLVRTGSEPVHTKYPVPVMRLTIPDARTARQLRPGLLVSLRLSQVPASGRTQAASGSLASGPGPGPGPGRAQPGQGVAAADDPRGPARPGWPAW
jgi:hypothetical protein